MAHPYHHALSSVRKWGGVSDDYIAIHNWFDESKALDADTRHRALRHHAEGIFMMEKIFGVTLTLSTGRVVPTRLIGEQHIKEDLGMIPSFVDWMRCIQRQPWMTTRSKLPETLEAGVEPTEPEQPDVPKKIWNPIGPDQLTAAHKNVWGPKVGRDFAFYSNAEKCWKGIRRDYEVGEFTHYATLPDPREETKS